MTDGILHEQIAHELHDLAEMVRSNPELAESFRFVFTRVLACVANEGDPKSVMAAFARAGKTAGAKIDKKGDDTWAELVLCFGEHVSLIVYAARDQVCEKVVTGTRKVTKEIPDPSAAKITVTEVEEIVDWKCSPVLADATTGGGEQR